MFSSRLPDLSPNALALAVLERRASGRPFVDLTETNPTRVGLDYPADLLGALADARALHYDPQPFGLRSAREAVARAETRRGGAVEPGRVVLTASSSESYALLFKLFCDPGTAVLVPAPSYPLFEHLAGLEAVRTRPYRLEYHGTWSIDAGTLEPLLDERTRAILAVSPNNPTGSYLRQSDVACLAEICRRYQLPLVVDEVFSDYPVAPAGDAVTSVADLGDVIVVALGGLSKSAALPQMKLGWMVWHGPDRLVSPALERLELICDTYLSVSTPVQVAAERLIAGGELLRRQVTDRILLNHRTLLECARRAPSCRVLPVEAGWSAVIQAPATETDDARALQILERAGVLVHPGYLFEFEREGFVVISLLSRPGEFRRGVSAMFDVIESVTP